MELLLTLILCTQEMPKHMKAPSIIEAGIQHQELFMEIFDDLEEKFPSINKLSEDEEEILHQGIMYLYDRVNIIRSKNGYPRFTKKYISSFVYSWIERESSFRINVKSSTGDYGLFQINYKTWSKYYQVRTPERLFDLKVNMEIAFDILLDCLEHENGSFIDALTRYNSGPRKTNPAYARKIITRIHELVNSEDRIEKV